MCQAIMVSQVKLGVSCVLNAFAPSQPPRLPEHASVKFRKIALNRGSTARDGMCMFHCMRAIGKRFSGDLLQHVEQESQQTTGKTAPS